MWQKPGLKTTWSKQTSVGPFLLEKPEVGRVVRPFRNQFCQLTGRPQLGPKIGLSLNPIRTWRLREHPGSRSIQLKRGTVPSTQSGTTAPSFRRQSFLSIRDLECVPQWPPVPGPVVTRPNPPRPAPSEWCGPCSLPMRRGACSQNGAVPCWY